MKTITLGDALDAIEKNGYPQIKYAFVHRDDAGNVTGACAIGQGALNLNVDYFQLNNWLQKIKTPSGTALSSSIASRNDGHGWSCKTIATHYRKKFADRLGEVLYEGE